MFLRQIATSANGIAASNAAKTTVINTLRSLSNAPLAEQDPKMSNLIHEENKRQHASLELIASENYTSHAVMECLGSCLTNKYSEGLPGARYYGGNEYVDQVEELTRQRALSLYGLDPEEWHVNVQPYSGSVANLSALLAILEPGQRLMGLDLPSGGHLTHGFYTSDKQGRRKSISVSGRVFSSFPYGVCEDTGLVDYESLERNSAIFMPELIMVGGSAYPREWDYARMREIADKCGAYVMTDMAHISGLVATGEADSPFAYSDIVTTTTHKTLRGPRAGIIFSRKANGLSAKVDFNVFPMIQGGPHQNQIAAVGTQLAEAAKPEFKQYIKQVKLNATTLTDALTSKGYVISTGGTSNHLFLWNLRPEGITGSKMEFACEAAGISLNKNSILGDKSALSPGGVRIGTPAMTTRGMDEKDCLQVADLLHRVVVRAKEIQDEVGKPLKVFKTAAATDTVLAQLKKDVNTFSQNFPMPGLSLDGNQALE